MNREAPTPRTATIRPFPPHPHFSLITLVEWIVIYKNIILKDSKSADQPVRPPSDPSILIVRAQLFSLQNQNAVQWICVKMVAHTCDWLVGRCDTGWVTLHLWGPALISLWLHCNYPRPASHCCTGNVTKPTPPALPLSAKLGLTRGGSRWFLRCDPPHSCPASICWTAKLHLISPLPAQLARPLKSFAVLY